MKILANFQSAIFYHIKISSVFLLVITTTLTISDTPYLGMNHTLIFTYLKPTS